MDNSSNYIEDMTDDMFQPLLSSRIILDNNASSENDEINEYLSDDILLDSEDESEEVEPPTPLPSPSNTSRSNEIMYQYDIEIQTGDNVIGVFTGNLNMNIPTPSITRRQYINSFLTNGNSNTSIYPQSPGQLDTNNDFRSRLISSLFPSSLEQEERQLSNVLNESLYQDTSRYKHVVSEDGKKNLKNKTFFLDKCKDQTSCPITQDDFEEGQLIIELPCLHIFEPDSIMEWLDTHSHKCPVCRYELDSKEVEDTSEKNDYHINTEEPENDTIEQMVQFLISNEMMNNEYLQQTLLESILGD